MKVRALAFALLLLIPSVTSAAELELLRDKMLTPKAPTQILSFRVTFPPTPADAKYQLVASLTLAAKP
jgi:hypothetical protein